MPTYEYECGRCGHHFDQFQGINAPRLRKCPACGKLSLRRLLGTGAGLLFKGSGFYLTDYRSSGYKQAAKADQAKASEGAKTSDSSTSGGAKPDASAKPAAKKT